MVDNEELNLTKKKKKKSSKLNDMLEADSAQEKKDPEIGMEAEEELDLSLKKKKKKKKTGIILDGEEESKGVGDLSASASADAPNEEIVNVPAKKNSLKAETEDIDDLPDDLETLHLTKKKKKKKTVLAEEKQVTFQEPGDEAQADDSTVLIGDHKWSGTDRDYNYEELLTRVFDIMRRKNPEMVAGEKKRFIMKPPQCARVGTKKTSFVNFNEICQMLHRQPKHVLAFILAELGASGSVDGNNQLIIKGRFQQKQLESVLRRYIKEYVTCHTCKSPDTLLERDVRLYFLRCRVCLSRCSVAAIKSGFQAVTNKRARIRAKAGP